MRAMSEDAWGDGLRQILAIVAVRQKQEQKQNSQPPLDDRPVHMCSQFTAGPAVTRSVRATNKINASPCSQRPCVEMMLRCEVICRI